MAERTRSIQNDLQRGPQRRSIDIRPLAPRASALYPAATSRRMISITSDFARSNALSPSGPPLPGSRFHGSHWRIAGSSPISCKKGTSVRSVSACRRRSNAFTTRSRDTTRSVSAVSRKSWIIVALYDLRTTRCGSRAASRARDPFSPRYRLRARPSAPGSRRSTRRRRARRPHPFHHRTVEHLLGRDNSAGSPLEGRRAARSPRAPLANPCSANTHSAASRSARSLSSRTVGSVCDAPEVSLERRASLHPGAAWSRTAAWSALALGAAPNRSAPSFEVTPFDHLVKAI